MGAAQEVECGPCSQVLVIHTNMQDRYGCLMCTSFESYIYWSLVQVLREAEVSRSLNHPNLVATVSVCDPLTLGYVGPDAPGAVELQWALRGGRSLVDCDVDVMMSLCMDHKFACL
jgi:hypothetical protein